MHAKPLNNPENAGIAGHAGQKKQFPMLCTKGLKMTIRYFVFSETLFDNDDDDPIEEVSEFEFLEFEGVIQYERHTMRENGCNQVCLTKYPEWFFKV